MSDKLTKYKEFVCSECCGKHSCCDLDGDLIDEQVKSCMEYNKKEVIHNDS